MKRFAAFILIFIFMTTTMIASSEEWSMMSDEELLQNYNAIRSELEKRGYKEVKNNNLLLDQAGIKVYINGRATLRNDTFPLKGRIMSIPILIVNDSNYNINLFTASDAGINGWDVNSQISEEVKSHRKKMGKLEFELDSTDIKTLGESMEIEVRIGAQNADDYYGPVVLKAYGPIKIHKDEKGNFTIGDPEFMKDE